MGRFVVVFLGAIVAVALMIAAIWGWIDLADWAFSGRRPEVLRWASRLTSIAAAAGAQVVVITFVIGQLYRLRRIHDLMRLVTAFVCCAAAVSAAALGLAAQG